MPQIVRWSWRRKKAGLRLIDLSLLPQQFDAALSDLNQWPEATRAIMLAGFVDALKMTDAALAARIQDAASKK